MQPSRGGEIGFRSMTLMTAALGEELRHSTGAAVPVVGHTRSWWRHRSQQAQ
jgi:hypothetical protein